MKLAKCGEPLDAIAFALERLSWLDGVPNDHSDPTRVLVEGWDYTADRSTVDAATGGIWRSPQFVPVSTNSGWQIGEPILAMDMTIDQIAAGLWRQLKMIPTAVTERKSGRCADPFKDCYGWVGSRDRLLEPFLGVSVRAVAMFVDDLRRSDPELAHALLSKNFASLEQGVEELAAIPWPAACLALFQQEGRKIAIPPVLALILHASLAQFAQTHAAHVTLSFAGPREITPKFLIELLRKRPVESFGLTRQFVTGAAALQTLVWTSRESTGVSHPVNTRGQLLSSAYNSLARNGGRTDNADESVATHPGSFSTRRGQSAVLAHRGAITRFGLTWRDSGALNLLIVHRQMKTWLKDYGHRLRRAKGTIQSGWRPGSLPEAMSRILHFWLETAVPEAAAEDLRQLVKSSGDELGQPIESIGGNDLGRQVLERARHLAAVFDRPDAIGYSALAHPSLWLRLLPPDQPEFDRLGQAARGDLKLLQARRGTPESVVDRMSLDGLRCARRARNKRKANLPSVPEVAFASRVAQALSMTMHVQATDPMHTALLSRSS